MIVDVTDGGTIAAAAARIGEATGGRLYGLVNNAGVAVPGPVEGVPLEKLREQLEVNVIGQVAVTQAFLPMVRAAKGRVVFISSIGGRISVPFNSPYGASKHAIEAIGDALRQEVAPFGVEVSIIEPGAVATPIWEKGQAGAPALREAMDPEVLALYDEGLEALEAVGGSQQRLRRGARARLRRGHPRAQRQRSRARAT